MRAALALPALGAAGLLLAGCVVPPPEGYYGQGYASPYPPVAAQPEYRTLPPPTPLRPEAAPYGSAYRPYDARPPLAAEPPRYEDGRYQAPGYEDRRYDQRRYEDRRDQGERYEAPGYGDPRTEDRRAYPSPENAPYQGQPAYQPNDPNQGYGPGYQQQYQPQYQPQYRPGDAPLRDRLDSPYPPGTRAPTDDGELGPTGPASAPSGLGSPSWR